jgi:hypothetical protein
MSEVLGGYGQYASLLLHLIRSILKKRGRIAMTQK